MIRNDKLLEQFAQAGISKSDIENLLSDAFIILMNSTNSSYQRRCNIDLGLIANSLTVR